MSERDNSTPSPSPHLVGSEAEELAEINAALKTINDTCLALQYDDRGRYGIETIEPLRKVAKLINKLVFLSASQSAPAEHRMGSIRTQAIEDVLSALTAHELYKYRPKAFEGFIRYARETLINDDEARCWRNQPETKSCVKPLEWVLMDDSATYHAQSILGRWARWDGHYLPPDGYDGIPCDDPIASAQRDYETRIRAALAATSEGGE